jgi:UDP-glucuronate 4-epimerase
VIGIDCYNDYYNPARKAKNVAPFKKNSNFQEYVFDILDAKKLESVFKKNKFDAIVHLAARAGVRPSLEQPQLYQQVNEVGTLNLLEMARQYKVAQFIFGSSSSVYGKSSRAPFSETDPCNEPVSPYAVSKKAAEMWCYNYSQLYQIKTTVLRFFTVYGPKGRPDMSPYIFTKKILAGEPITVYGDGGFRRDFTYIDDIVSGIAAAIAKPLAFEIINLGNNHPVTIKELISTIEAVSGCSTQVNFEAEAKGDVPLTYADITKAKKLLGWQPTTDLKQGLIRFADWFKTT